jgi:hypothetical protein
LRLVKQKKQNFKKSFFIAFFPLPAGSNQRGEKEGIPIILRHDQRFHAFALKK